MTGREWQLWLEWFYLNARFGPAHDDVVDLMKEQFTKETGIIFPDEE